MPRRALDPGSKPFEVKVGVGFQSFGGMYQLGDPSMCPPNRFRKLINVRLGGKDIASRPGENPEWTTTGGDPVIGMTQIYTKDAGKIFFGPFGNFGTGLDGPSGYYWDDSVDAFSTYVFWGLVVDQGPLSFDSGHYLGYIPLKMPQYQTVGAAEIVQFMGSIPENYWEQDPVGFPVGGGIDTPLIWKYLAPVARYPYLYATLDPGHGGGAPAVSPIPAGRNVCTQLRWYHSMGHLPSDPSFTFTHEHAHEDIATVGLLTFCGILSDDGQCGSVLDPTILFQGKWLVVGSIVPVFQNPAVLGGKASGAAGTGQQVFEVTLNSNTPSATPPNLKAWIPSTEKLWDNFFGGSLTELFRMPGVSVNRIPARTAGGLADGATIRSMCVRSVRNDSPITAAQATSEILYVGTFGGSPLSASTIITRAAWTDLGVPAGNIHFLKQGIHSLADGKVYSWDGSTLREETTGLGPAVVVTTLPDGSVLACGRTAAKLLDAADNTWKPVAYDPVASTLPLVRWGGFPQDKSVYLSANLVDANFEAVGFMWLDRVVFRGTAYYIGFDTARLAPGCETEVVGAQSQIDHLWPPDTFGLVPPGGPPSIEWAESYQPSADAVVIYAFDKSTMKMVEVRDGADFLTTVGVSPFATYCHPYTVALRPACPFALGVVDDTLYYSWALKYDGGREAWIGSFNGSWNDDAVDLDDEPCNDMLATGSALYVHKGVGTIPYLYVLDGGQLVLVGSTIATGSVIFAPGAYPQRMFVGLR